MARLFIAVDVPPAAKDAAAAAIEQARDSVSSARWVPRDNLHVTIKFLGNVEDSLVDPITRECATAASHVPAFDVVLGGLGVFPSARRVRVVWIGVLDESNGFGALSDAVEDALNPLGFEREARAYTPHLTIARLKVPAAVTLPVIELGMRVRVDALTLFESHLGRPAPRYEALRRFGLG